MEWPIISLCVVVYTMIICAIAYCVGYENGTDARDAISEVEAARLALKVRSCQLEAAVLRAKYNSLNRKFKAMEGVSE